MRRLLPHLHEVQHAVAPSAARKIVVFIHGIFSSHETFSFLLARFTSDGDFDDHDLATYDYDWGEPIETSARKLRNILNGPRIPAGAEVTLVCHSMGGLVARFALMGGDLKCVKRIFMLGTPNFGAMRASQMGTVWQLAVAGAGKLTPFFPRKAGLRDLTQVQRLYLDALGSGEISPARADGVEYVTVPGMYYYSDRRTTEVKSRAELVFSVGKLSVEAITFLSGTQIGIEVPNDGVVEESSVNLVSDKAGQRSEKSAGVSRPAVFGVTCCHVTPNSAYRDTHMAIQQDMDVADVIKAIMRERSILDWYQKLTPADLHDTRVDIRLP